MALMARRSCTPGTPPIVRYRAGYLVAPNGCWLWNQPVDRYPSFSIDGRMVRVHRWAYETFVGSIPSGLYVLHRCDDTHCVNPSHLMVGTQRDNVQDMLAKGRDNYARGEGSASSTLTEDDIRAIRSIARQGDMSLRALALRFGVSRSAVARACTGDTWAHVPEILGPDEYRSLFPIGRRPTV
jgi:hypothetical protein